jgi:iron complex outermembrane receptor protein
LREGIELATKHQFSDHWRGQASATTMRAIYQNWSTKSGNALPGIPNKQIFSSIAWSQKGLQPSGTKQISGAEVSLDWIGRSVMWASDTNDSASTASGYSIFNARFKQRFEIGPSQLEAYLGINNLTDQKTIGSVIINQSSSQYFEPGLPRNWVVGLIGKLPLQ